MTHNPAPKNDVSLVFKPVTMLSKEVYICDKSKVRVVTKKPRKGAVVLKEYPASAYKEATLCYLDESGKHKKTNTDYYLIINTDEVDQETVVCTTAKR